MWKYSKICVCELYMYNNIPPYVLLLHMELFLLTGFANVVRVIVKKSTYYSLCNLLLPPPLNI